MAHVPCETEVGKLRRQVNRPRKSRGGRPSAALIEQTRHLMERTIEFVDHPDFQLSDTADRILATRPDSLDQPQAPVRTATALAFVSGFAEAPLLTPEEERFLFTWMNFLKSRAESNRRELDLSHPSQDQVDGITSDLDQALCVRNQIVQGNIRLVVALAKKLSSSLDQMSDLISDGMPPLIRSVELFNIHLGNRFSTYATWAVRNQMLRSMKRARTSPEHQSREFLTTLENLPEKRPQVITGDTVLQLRTTAVSRLLASLPDRDRKVVTARFGLEGQPHSQTLAEIADQMGLSKERVRQIVLGSMAKLRESITYDEFESMN